MRRAAADRQLVILIKAGKRERLELERRIPFLVESRNDYSRSPVSLLSALPLPFPPLTVLSFSTSLSLLLLSYLRRQKYSQRAPPRAAIMLSTGVRLLGTVMRIF